LHEIIDDVAHEIRRDREAHALEAAGAAENGGIEADQAAVDVDERAAGVAGIDGGVGLNEVLIGEARFGRRPLALTMPVVTVSPDAERIADGEHAVADLGFWRSRRI